jgi:WD40 repeat protein
MQNRLSVTPLTKQWLSKQLEDYDRRKKSVPNQSQVDSNDVQQIREILQSIDTWHDNEPLPESAICQLYVVIEQSHADPQTLAYQIVNYLRADLNYAPHINDTLKGLPNEMWEQVLRFLPKPALLSARQACKPLYQCASNFFLPTIPDYETKASSASHQLALYSCTAAISPQGNTFAIANAEGNIILVDHQNTLIHLFQESQGDECLALAFTKDNRFLLSSHPGTVICLWDLEKKQLLGECRTAAVGYSAANWMLLAPLSSGHLIIATHASLMADVNEFMVIDPTKPDVVNDNDAFFQANEDHCQRFTSIQLSQDETLLACYSEKNASIYLYDVASRRLNAALKLEHGKTLETFAITKDNNIITCCWTEKKRELQLWNSTTGKTIHDLFILNLPDVTGMLAFSKPSVSGSYIAFLGRGCHPQQERIGFIVKLDPIKQTFHLTSFMHHDVGRAYADVFLHQDKLTFIVDDTMTQYRFPSKPPIQLRDNFAPEANTDNKNVLKL